MPAGLHAYTHRHSACFPVVVELPGVLAVPRAAESTLLWNHYTHRLVVDECKRLFTTVENLSGWNETPLIALKQRPRPGWRGSFGEAPPVAVPAEGWVLAALLCILPLWVRIGLSHFPKPAKGLIPLHLGLRVNAH